MERQAGAAAVIIAFDDLPHGPEAHRFVGADHGDLSVSVILVHCDPGCGPSLHRHPYPEVFVVEAGEATFEVEGQTTVVASGHVVDSPPGVAHRFTNTGSTELRIVSIHPAGRFQTEDLPPDHT